ESAREALSKAHEAASQGTEIASQAIQHAYDAFDAVRAAAMDAVHTKGDDENPLSGPVNALKQGLMAAADMAVNVGKAGMTLAQAAITQGKTAIEMCASQAPALAKPVIEALAGQLDKVVEAVKTSGDAAGKSINGAVAAGGQNVLDSVAKSIKSATNAIAEAKKALKEGADQIKKNVGDRLKDAVGQARGLVDQVQGAVKDAKATFEQYKKQVEDTIDKYGGKWISAGRYIAEHGKKAYEAGKSCLEHLGNGIDLLKKKQWDDAGKEVDPAQKDFETARTEAQLVFGKLKEVEKDLPEQVRSLFNATIDQINQTIPAAQKSLADFIEAVKARVGALAA